MKQKFSVIVTSDNESSTGKLVDTMANCEHGENFILNKIFVVTCGDKEIQENENVIIIKEATRKGKAAAINKALRLFKDEIVVLASADITINNDTIRNLLYPFSELSVGMSCSRPVSNDNAESFAGFLNSLVWDLHHFVSETHPKGGELVAFRKVISEIPESIAADEAYIESKITGHGYKIAYVPSAMVSNYGPVALSDFITQRRRIFSGHLQVKSLNGYLVSTAKHKVVLRALLKYLRKNPKSLKLAIWIFAAALIETYSRFLGFLDYKTNKVMFIWPRYKRGDENSRIGAGHNQIQSV